MSLTLRLPMSTAELDLRMKPLQLIHAGNRKLWTLVGKNAEPLLQLGLWRAQDMSFQTHTWHSRQLLHVQLMVLMDKPR
jgi:hypothetical protein